MANMDGDVVGATIKVAKIATAIFVGAMSHAAAEENGIGRYQLMGTAPITVIDTATGQLWTVKDDSGWYAMLRICYRGRDSQLMPTPYEDKFTKDLRKFKAECTPAR